MCSPSWTPLRTLPIPSHCTEKTLQSQEERGMTEGKLVGWHHRLNGLESRSWWRTGNLACCSPWGCKESDTTERPNIGRRIHCCCCLVAKLCLILLQPRGLWPAWLPCSWGFSGKDTGVSCHFLLQRIFLTFQSPALAGRFFTTELPGKPIHTHTHTHTHTLTDVGNKLVTTSGVREKSNIWVRALVVQTICCKISSRMYCSAGRI